MLLLTAAIFLLVAGQLMQFRLFSDPEYGARGAARAKARDAKAQTVRLLNVETGLRRRKENIHVRRTGSRTQVARHSAASGL